MNTKDVDYHSSRITAHLVVGRANLEMGYHRLFLASQHGLVLEQLRRGLAEAQAKQAAGEETNGLVDRLQRSLALEQGLTRSYLREIVFPDLVAATREARIEQEGQLLSWPPEFEEFCDWLDDQELQSVWLDAVYELNPHWKAPSVTEPDDSKKAVPMPST